jgi:hypothetical protein
MILYATASVYGEEKGKSEKVLRLIPIVPGKMQPD